MSIIEIQDLTFGYDGRPELVFESVSFRIDTDWRLGFTGRNGRGKTTFLKLLMGEYEYRGQIRSSVGFEYFPYPVAHPEASAMEAAKEVVAPFARWEREMERLCGKTDEASLAAYGEAMEQYLLHEGYTIEEAIRKEASLLEVKDEALGRPFGTLSCGEQTKVLLAALFLKKNRFLLLDEPTNHLDASGRGAVEAYLRTKKGFLLVSHDRALLDAVTDHTLAVNRRNIEIQKGGFSAWQAQKERRDRMEAAQNERLEKEIAQYREAAARACGWSKRAEAEKTGEGSVDRGFLGHKAAKLMKRSKAIEARSERAAEEAAGLLCNVDVSEPLTMRTHPFEGRRLAEAKGLCLRFGEKVLFEGLDFELLPGDRAALTGPNGSGKSTLLRLLLGESGAEHTGSLFVAPGLKISYIPQDTSLLRGSIREICRAGGLEESFVKALLRKMDFSREQLEGEVSGFSEGQKKKVLLAASLSRPAHLYIWDEPLNFVDVLTRLQLEEAIRRCRPTLLFVEHDRTFTENVATKCIRLEAPKAAPGCPA